ncbi:TRAP transporter small permease [Ferviditalea candida]|uniref:TRAP transporter small permease n=1 Tax=Ferviditalea candida TaxID=3108399 RepID=A0ABU5ZIY1_9BACL|nr:TRAP transporter small permease [Paenibacillaceae bacterium T2]
MLEAFARKINRVVEFLLFIFLSVMTIVVALQVLFRYVINEPLFWTEELARYLMIYIVYMGASVGVRWGSHVGFTFFVGRISPALAKWLAIIANLGLLAFTLNFIYYGLQIALQNYDQLSGAMEIPMTYLFMVLPISGVLIIIQLLPHLERQFKELKELRNSVKSKRTRGGTP